ncbi:hypothetical protein NHQ30_002595 [Ciborinia camelliae]|nr:hypothetical protein NHQ30_002595 [Ciborinia camelliae]
MSAQHYTQEFEMDFEKYLENLRADLYKWDQAITGTISNRIFRSIWALSRLQLKITSIERKRNILASNTMIAKAYQAELLSEYEHILSLMYPMLEWFETIKGDYLDLRDALKNGDSKTAEEIAKGLELEPGNIRRKRKAKAVYRHSLGTSQPARSSAHGV